MTDNTKEEIQDQIKSHGLPEINVPPPNFTTLTGAINYFQHHAMTYMQGLMTFEQVQTLLLITLVHYRYSENVLDLHPKSEIERLKEENERLKADMEEAAGLLLVPIPEHGTDLAKVMHANIMMRKYRIPELLARIKELEHPTSDAVDKQIEQKSVNRVEVIDGKGRSYVNWKKSLNVTLAYQDGGKALKIFIR